MPGNRLRRARAVAVGGFVGLVWLGLGTVGTGSVLRGAAVGGVTALVAMLAGVVASTDRLPGLEDRRRIVGAWILVAVVAGGLAVAGLQLASLPGYLATYLPPGIAVGIAAAATASVAGDAIAAAVRERLGEETRDRLGQAGEVFVRVPGLDLLWIVRAFEDDDNADTVRLLALAVVPFGLAYAAFPLDLVPDVLVPIGWIDDVTVYVVLREVVFVGHDRKTNVRGAVRYALFGRFERLLLALAVALAAVLVVVLGVLFLLL